jgi:DNA-binding NarL/FixJ family response regulator
MGTAPSPITVLLIDSDKRDREYWAQRLTISSRDYVVLEADTGASGLAICHSQQVDCVVTELDLCDGSGFRVLLDLVPRVRYPDKAVIILSRLNLHALSELARKNGAFAYLVKSHLSGDALDEIIRKAVAVVGSIQKEPSR